MSLPANREHDFGVSSLIRINKVDQHAQSLARDKLVLFKAPIATTSPILSASVAESVIHVPTAMEEDSISMAVVSMPWNGPRPISASTSSQLGQHPQISMDPIPIQVNGELQFQISKVIAISIPISKRID